MSRSTREKALRRVLGSLRRELQDVREYYETHLRDVDQRLATCEENCRRLVERNRKLDKENDQLRDRLSTSGYDPWSES